MYLCTSSHPVTYTLRGAPLAKKVFQSCYNCDHGYIKFAFCCLILIFVFVYTYFCINSQCHEKMGK